jgi:hypothetical protein
MELASQQLCMSGASECPALRSKLGLGWHVKQPCGNMSTDLLGMPLPSPAHRQDVVQLISWAQEVRKRRCAELGSSMQPKGMMSICVSRDPSIKGSEKLC